MNKKPLTYVLVVAALGIWIYVFYSIFSVINGDDEPFKVRTSNKSLDTSSTVQEKYALLLNYSDPFLKNRKAVYAASTGVASNVAVSSSGTQIREAASEKTDQKKADLAKANEVTMLFCKTVSYSGLIRNNVTKKNIAILTIENKEYMMAAGETVNGVTLLKIVSDSIEVKCIGRKMYVKKGA